MRWCLLALCTTSLLLVSAAPAAAFFQVTVTKAGPGAAAGTVTSEPPGIDCGTECGPHNFGLSAVKLTATPGPGDVFAGWSGASCDGGPKSNPCEFSFLTNFEDRNFTATFAPPPDPPHATTGAPAPVGEFAATMKGTVNPGGSAVEECRFEYGTTTDYGASLPCVPAAAELGEGAADVAVSAQATHLEPDTTYHYRLVAGNFSGASEGADMTFTTAGARVCSNADRRLEQGIGSILLPGCMALEMVSPPQKNSQPANYPTISADGDRVRFYSIAALGETPNLLSFGGDAYVATRGASGWITAPTTPPGDLTRGWGSTAVAKGFSPDFSTWFQVAATETQKELGIARAFRGGLGGLFTPFSPRLEPLGGGQPEDVSKGTIEGASADGSHLFFRPGERSVAYLPADPRPSGPVVSVAFNVYVARLNASGLPSLELFARDGDGKAWGGTCGTRIGGFIGSGVNAAERNQGAISPDGTRVYFSLRPDQSESENCDATVNKLRIYKRLESQQGTWIGPLFLSECIREAPPCSTVDGDDRYQGASADGSRVYFTTNRQLANSDVDGTAAECSPASGVAGCDLYLFDSSLPPGQRLVQVSAGQVTASHPTVGADARVYDGTVGISGDGSHVYFAAAGVLTEDQNPEGAQAVDGQPNLYLYQRDDAHPEGNLSFIGTLDTGDRNVLWGREGTWRNGAYPVPVLGSGPGGDGHVLFFQSNASLTVADADGGRRDVYRYDAAAAPPTLECVSCRPGDPDSAPFDVTARRAREAAGPDLAEEGRWASEHGEAALFTTSEGLLPGEGDGDPKLYLWRGGELARLPGEPYVTGTSQADGRLDGPVISGDGAEVAFQTVSPLLPQDGDTTSDVYVARAGGGFPNSTPPIPCDPGSNCRQPQASPAAPGSATEAPTQGNVKPEPDRCSAPARQARNLSKRARRLLTRARRAARHNPQRAKAQRRHARRLSGRAHRLSRRAKRCRAGLPPQAKPAGAKRSSAHRAHHRRNAR